MEKLYLKLIELLGELPEIKYIDLDVGQLQEEKPPLAYPAVLVRLSENREDVEHLYQLVTGNVQLTVVAKHLQKTNSLTPEEVRKAGLEYMRLNDRIHDQLQGYADDRFRAFTCTGKNDTPIRTGLKTIVQNWTTEWHESK